MKQARFIKVPSYVMVPNTKGEWISVGELHFYSAVLDAIIIVPSFTVNNLASIPRPFRNAFPVNGPSRPAAAVHDHLYEEQGAIQVQYADNSRALITITREQSDDIFKEALLALRGDFYLSLPREARNALASLERDHFFTDVDNQNKTLCSARQAWVMHKAVRVGGGFYWS